MVISKTKIPYQQNFNHNDYKLAHIEDLIESKREGDLIKYAKDKYIIPLKLKNTDKSKEFIKSGENKSITTNKQIDDFFNKKSKTTKNINYCFCIFQC